ncbi:MAG: hypothetical protein IJ267_01450 [Bacteroidales bacterium]|nr:hypothetical protein [Bacteroidales bacterium]
MLKRFKSYINDKILNTKERKIGFYSTVVFHLLVIIILLASTIHNIVAEETAFVLDFTGLEAMEQRVKEEEIKVRAQQEVEDMLSGKLPSASAYRNVAVDRSSSGRNLRDDRHKNPSQVYDEARELQRKLDESRRQAMMEQGSDDVADPNKKESEKKAEAYKGPSVISYSLDGRKALSLPVPVYKCYGGGDMYVQIVVNRKGYVVEASIIEGSSTSSDGCLIRAALDAAKRSRFRASSKAPEKQIGEIVYRFIAQ